MATVETARITLPAKPNRLRNALQNYWGYNFLDIDILLKHTEVEHEAPRNANKSEQMSVQTLLEELKPEIGKKRVQLQNAARPASEDKPRKQTYFQRYQNSPWKGRMQRFKKVPFAGSTLLYVKRKILKWDI